MSKGLAPLLLAAVMAGNLGADVIQTDFSSQPAGSRFLDPSGAATRPNPRIEDGVLKLTDANDPGGFGGFAIGPSPTTSTISALSASWKSRIGAGGVGGADGYSFNIGSDLLDDFTGEEGSGTGLTVTIDTWDNGAASDPGGTGIQIKWGGAIVAFAPIPKDNPGNGIYLRKDTFVDASVTVSAAGNIVFTYDGTTISYAVPAYAGFSANQINFAARTGGANDNHWIDDLTIVTQGPDVALIPIAGSEWAFNESTTTPGLSAAWKDPGYNTNSEPGWKTGLALFGNDSAGVYDGAGSPFAGQGLNGFLTPLDRTGGRITFYFRKDFNWSGSTAGVVLKSTYVADDAIAIYLNGVEIYRNFFAVGAADPITWDTLGQNHDPEGTRFNLELPSTALVAGNNTLAVEVHQVNGTSSDVAFAMSLAGAPPVPPTIVDGSQPASRTIFANRTTTLTVSALGSPAPHYQWYFNGAAIDPAVNPTATNASLVIASMQPADQGDYFARVSNPIGSADSRTATVTYVNDVAGPTVVRADSDAHFDKVVIQFDELINPTGGADQTFSYTLDPVINVVSVTVNPDNRSVTLFLETLLVPDANYTVTATEVYDLAGNVIGTPNSATFHTYAYSPGFMVKEWFLNYTAGVDALMADAARLARPDITSYTNIWEMNAVDTFENYGGRISGFYTASEDGPHVFYISTDDPGRLFISTDESPANKVLVASEPVWAGRRQWVGAGADGSGSGRVGVPSPSGGPDANITGPINMVKGQRYYVESFFTEGGGGDNMAVAVQLPSQTTPPVNGSSPITSFHMGSLAPAGEGTVAVTTQPTPVTTLENQSATFTISGNGSFRGDTTVSYSWERSDDNGANWVGVATTTSKNGQSSYTLPVATMADNGDKYRARLFVLGASATSDLATLTVETDTTAPTILSATFDASLTNITINFSELMDHDSVSSVFNYLINGGVSIASATAGADGRSVILGVDPAMSLNTTYTVTVNDVSDRATGAPNFIAPNTTVTIGSTVNITQQPVSQTFVVSSDVLLSQNFDSGDGGFTVENTGVPASPWSYNAANGTWSSYHTDPCGPGQNASRLNSPALTVSKTGRVSVTLKHRYSFEGDHWDGGQLRVSVNGGAFTTVPASAFIEGSYTSTSLVGNHPLIGQAAWNGNSANYASGAYITSQADLGVINAGDTVAVQLLAAWDECTAGLDPSWQVDSVALNQGGGASQSVTFSVVANAVMSGNANPPLSYQWYRDNGAGFVIIPGATGPNYVIGPIVTDNGAKFRVVVSTIGSVATSDTATLTVLQPNTPPQFACGPNQTVVENAGAQSVLWATGIQPHNIVRTSILYGSDFASLPPGSSVAGNAAVADGVLHLTDAVNSQSGQFFTPSAGALIESFTLDFKLRMGGGTCCGGAIPEGTSRMADGLSVNIGNDLGAGFGEEGTGTGLIVSFDLWDNGEAGSQDASYTAPNIDVRNGGTAAATVGYQALDGDREGGRAPSGPFVTDPATGAPMKLITGDAFAPVHIRMDADGTIDVDYKGVRILDNLQTGYRPIQNPRIGIGARTGGANAAQWVDDLQLQAFSPDSSSAELSQTVSFVVTTDNAALFSVQPAVAADGTLTYTPAAGASGTANVTVVAKDNGGTANGGHDTSAPCSFTITVTPGCTAPVAVNDTGSTASGVAVTLNVLANDTDVEGGLTVTAVTQGANGVVAISGAGVSYTPAAGFIGTDTFTYTAANSCGASSTATVTVRVLDGIAPVVVCPGDISAEATSASGAVVQFTATATDNSGVVNVVCVPASGSTFAVGATPVTCTATDGTGNRATCSFSVTVRESGQPPTAVIGAEALVDFSPDFENPVLISCNWWNACLVLDGWTSSAADGGALTYLWFDELEAVPFDSGVVTTNCYEVGTHTITLTVTDSKGLSDSDSKTIEVLTAPLAIELLMEKVQQSRVTRAIKRELVASLRVALNKAKDEKIRQTQNALDAFEKKVRAKLTQNYPEEARVWIKWSQSVSTGMEKCIKPPRKAKDHWDKKKGDDK